MLLICVLICLLPFIVSDDFDEITYRHYGAMVLSKQQLENIVNIAKEGRETYDRAMFVHCNGTDYLRNFTFLANYDYLNNARIMNANLVKVPTRDNIYRLYTSTLFIEVRGNNFSLSVQFRHFKKAETEQWELYKVEDLKCDLPKKDPLQEAVEMAQYFYFSEGKWENEMLSKMFFEDSWCKFCDGSVERYFFHRNDALSKDSVTLNHVVKFEREVHRSFGEISFTLLSNILMVQMDVTVNGRRMQLEYDDDWKMFTKGREYPCNGDNVENWVEK